VRDTSSQPQALVFQPGSATALTARLGAGPRDATRRRSTRAVDEKLRPCLGRQTTTVRCRVRQPRRIATASSELRARARAGATSAPATTRGRADFGYHARQLTQRRHSVVDEDTGLAPRNEPSLAARGLTKTQGHGRDALYLVRHANREDAPGQAVWTVRDGLVEQLAPADQTFVVKVPPRLVTDRGGASVARATSRFSRSPVREEWTEVDSPSCRGVDARRGGL
jgi:hypothetical protein